MAVELIIKVDVPPGTCPIAYRNRVEARASELGGWPEPHGAGTYFGPDGDVADLQWTLGARTGLDHVFGVIAALRAEFEVVDVHVEPSEGQR